MFFSILHSVCCVYMFVFVTYCCNVTGFYMYMHKEIIVYMSWLEYGVQNKVLSFITYFSNLYLILSFIEKYVLALGFVDKIKLFFCSRFLLFILIFVWIQQERETTQKNNGELSDMILMMVVLHSFSYIFACSTFSLYAYCILYIFVVEYVCISDTR